MMDIDLRIREMSWIQEEGQCILGGSFFRILRHSESTSRSKHLTVDLAFVAPSATRGL